MSREVRARFEVAQAERSRSLVVVAEPGHEALESQLNALRAETERLEQTASVLRRRLVEHRVRHHLLDEARSGRPVHPGAWFSLPLAWVVFALQLAFASPLGVWWLVAIASVEAWSWVRQVKRSARLSRDLGSEALARSVELGRAALGLGVDQVSREGPEDSAYSTSSS